jgi:hypothetical protein
MTNLDEAIAELERMDLADEVAEGERKIMTPVDYARLRGVKPQLVYYYVKVKKLIPAWCDCGRKCINVSEADALFAIRDKKRLEKSGGVEVKE